jgi:hypothetical protein
MRTDFGLSFFVRKSAQKCARVRILPKRPSQPDTLERLYPRDVPRQIAGECRFATVVVRCGFLWLSLVPFVMCQIRQTFSTVYTADDVHREIIRETQDEPTSRRIK